MKRVEIMQVPVYMEIKIMQLILHSYDLISMVNNQIIRADDSSGSTGSQLAVLSVQSAAGRGAVFVGCQERCLKPNKYPKKILYGWKAHDVYYNEDLMSPIFQDCALDLDDAFRT